MCCKNKSRHAPHNEEAELIKSKMLQSSYDWPGWVLGFIPWGKADWKIGMMELNEILFNSIPNSWSKQACVHGFHCEYITLQKYVNMFERMDIAECIYEGVV